jgi:hypothetical protein
MTSEREREQEQTFLFAFAQIAAQHSASNLFVILAIST